MSLRGSFLFSGDAAPPGHPYWWDEAPPEDTGDALPDKVDLLIVGGGYTGLSAAIAAHDAGAKVAVVDSGQPGRGASSRNGGMVGAHPRLPWEALERHFGEKVADAVFAEAAPALDFVHYLMVREGIECDYQRCGRVQMAYTAAHHDGQKRLATALADKSSVKAQVLDREAMLGEINTPLYKGAILFPEHGALHPGKYHRGMLRAVGRRGVPVTGDCAVTGWERDAAGFEVNTARGTVRAEKLLLATNGYTPTTFRWFNRRIFALPSYIIATEPLSANLIGDLAPGRRTMVETRARHSYFRLSPDGTRVLYGGRASMVGIDLRKAAARLHATMCEVWPDMAGVKISHVWSGNTGFSFRQMPHVGEHDGVHYALGYSGSGTVMAPYLGAKAALRALGDPGGSTVFSKTVLTPSLLHPGGPPHFLKAANAWYRGYVDRAEGRAARRS
ncbi:MAG: FAD-binding oxidoreductase [Pseudomonadota bacterium]